LMGIGNLTTKEKQARRRNWGLDWSRTSWDQLWWLCCPSVNEREGTRKYPAHSRLGEHQI
jgi:hypothetical protein